MNRTLLALTFLVVSTAAFGNTDLSGVVTDAAGKPVAAAHVYVYTAHPKSGIGTVCPSCYRDCGKHVDVAADGSFNLKDLDTTLAFDVLAVADSYQSAFANRVDPGKGRVTIALHKREAADAALLIRGRVVDPDGKPVVGAIVQPNGYHIGNRTGYGNLPGIEKLSITNADGAFELKVKEAEAKLDVRVTARSLAPRIERALVPGDQARTIQLTEGATIVGHIVRDGQPVAGARVLVNQVDHASGNWLGQFEIGTNEQGAFTLPNLKANEAYEVGVAADEKMKTGKPLATVRLDYEKSVVDAGTIKVAGRTSP